MLPHDSTLPTWNGVTTMLQSNVVPYQHVTWLPMVQIAGCQSIQMLSDPGHLGLTISRFQPDEAGREVIKI
jgi:hypothetical protein